MHLHKKLKHLFKGFTLVELIVVISVLGVLATIAFTQISNVTLSARNSTRMTNIQSISSSLNIYKATNGTYPIPDNKTDILYSGSIIGYQGYIKDTAARLLKLSPSSSQDPLNTSTYFSYAINQSRTNAQLLGFLEANTTSFKALPVTFASDELSTKTPYSKGEELGILYTSGTTTPLSGTSIELNTTANSYTAYYNSTDSLAGTGNLLQNLVISYSHGSGFGSPSADDCPNGFIPVPGNKDFNQPGFCVMKYEAKVINGIVNTYGGHTYSLADSVVSNAKDYPINFVSQSQALVACKNLGVGYHLITNNEWMTMARNIESVASNWSSGIVGSGFLYSGHNDKFPLSILNAGEDDKDGYYGTQDSTGFPGDSMFGSYTSNTEQAYIGQKRTLSFSNEQVIWDLAGNVWEYVNKANTIDGNGFASGQSAFSSATTKVCPWDSTNGGCFELTGASELNNPSLFTKSFGNYTSAQGVGMSYLYTGVPSNVFLRGGGWTNGLGTGIFTLALHWSANDSTNTVGFRCTK